MTFTNFKLYFNFAWDLNVYIGEDPLVYMTSL